MINLTIDGKQIEVLEGTTILQAAEVNGIEIPTLCNHSNLKPYGGCRLCMVEVEGARILQPSCTLPAANGMVVHTNTEKVMEARKFVLSLIFSERNHFCMYCQATDGDCELQNAAYAESLDHWPLTPNYSPFTVDASHKYFVLDNNRCILCRRCVRACSELVGNFTLGFEERGASSLLVADYGLPLGESSCISCGTCVQICPTGALIDRRSAYQGRLTDLDHHVSVCTECSIGCQHDVLTRDNRLVRIDGVWQSPLSEGLLCEKGRYQPLDVDGERIHTPLIRKDGQHRAATWDEAMNLIVNKFASVKNGASAALASARFPIETLALFKKIFDDGGKTGFIGTVNGSDTANISKAVAEKLGNPYEAKLDVLKNCDVALVVGADLVADHQVAGFFLKRQMLDEIKIIIADENDNDLISRSSLKMKPKPGTAEDFVHGLSMAWNTLVHEKDLFAEKELEASSFKTGIEIEKTKKAVKWLGDAGKPVIIIGKDFVTKKNLNAFERLVSFAQKIRASIIVIKDQANSLAASLLGYSNDSFPANIQAAFLAIGDEATNGLLLQKTSHVPFLAVYSAYQNQITEQADVILPATIWAEEGGSYLNTDGRVQLKVVAIESQKEVWDSLRTVQKLAEKFGLSPEVEWENVIKQQLSSVEIAVE